MKKVSFLNIFHMPVMFKCIKYCEIIKYRENHLFFLEILFIHDIFHTVLKVSRETLKFLALLIS